MDSVTSTPSPPGGRRKQRSLLGARPVLVQRDGDRSPAPVRRGGRGREPKIDHCALNRPAGIRGDALAVTGNRHLGPERDDARINGDDAVADRCAGGGVALQRVGGRGYRQRRLAGGGGCCLRWYRYRRRGLRGHALDGNATSLGRDRLCLRIESADLRLVEPSPGGELLQIGDASRLRGNEHGSRGGDARLEPMELLRPRGEPMLKPDVAITAPACLRDDRSVGLGRRVLGFKAREGVVKRLRAEDDGQWV